MPTTNNYTENAEKWKVLADIDYITQFVKAWIAFNAWYKNYFPEFQKFQEFKQNMRIIQKIWLKKGSA